MKSFIVLALCFAAALAVPLDPSRDAVILRFNNDNIGTGPFNFGFESSDGTRNAAEGIIKNVGTENEATEVRGEFSYVALDGITYTVTYIANELGYQPSAPHLPA